MFDILVRVLALLSMIPVVDRFHNCRNASDIYKIFSSYDEITQHGIVAITLISSFIIYEIIYFVFKKFLLFIKRIFLFYNKLRISKFSQTSKTKGRLSSRPIDDASLNSKGDHDAG